MVNPQAEASMNPVIEDMNMRERMGSQAGNIRIGRPTRMGVIKTVGAALLATAVLATGYGLAGGFSDDGESRGNGDVISPEEALTNCATLELTDTPTPADEIESESFFRHTGKITTPEQARAYLSGWFAKDGELAGKSVDPAALAAITTDVVIPATRPDVAKTGVAYREGVAAKLAVYDEKEKGLNVARRDCQIAAKVLLQLGRFDANAFNPDRPVTKLPAVRNEQFKVVGQDVAEPAVIKKRVKGIVFGYTPDAATVANDFTPVVLNLNEGENNAGLYVTGPVSGESNENNGPATPTEFDVNGDPVQIGDDGEIVEPDTAPVTVPAGTEGVTETSGAAGPNGTNEEAGPGGVTDSPANGGGGPSTTEGRTSETTTTKKPSVTTTTSPRTTTTKKPADTTTTEKPADSTTTTEKPADSTTTTEKKGSVTPVPSSTPITMPN